MKTDLKEFAEKIKEIVGKTHDYRFEDKRHFKVYSLYGGKQKSAEELSLYEVYIYSKYCIGGMTGGSCWNDSQPKYSTWGAEDPKTISGILADIVEEYCPNISFVKGTKLMTKLLEKEDTENETIPEYYGNSTEYKIHKIKVVDIYDILVENGMLNND